jgi:hypothetical protein
MKYVIIEDNKVKKVSQGIYEYWLENKSDQFILPAYTKKLKNKKFIIDTDFVGTFEKNQPVQPFVLFQYEEQGNTVKDVVEHFETFEELKKRRQELIEQISKN